jgi:hypothetical protein
MKMLSLLSCSVISLLFVASVSAQDCPQIKADTKIIECPGKDCPSVLKTNSQVVDANQLVLASADIQIETSSRARSICIEKSDSFESLNPFSKVADHLFTNDGEMMVYHVDVLFRPLKNGELKLPAVYLNTGGIAFKLVGQQITVGGTVNSLRPSLPTAAFNSPNKVEKAFSLFSLKTLGEPAYALSKEYLKDKDLFPYIVTALSTVGEDAKPLAEDILANSHIFLTANLKASINMLFTEYIDAIIQDDVFSHIGAIETLKHDLLDSVNEVANVSVDDYESPKRAIFNQLLFYLVNAEGSDHVTFTDQELQKLINLNKNAGKFVTKEQRSNPIFLESSFAFEHSQLTIRHGRPLPLTEEELPILMRSQDEDVIGGLLTLNIAGQLPRPISDDEMQNIFENSKNRVIRNRMLKEVFANKLPTFVASQACKEFASGASSYDNPCDAIEDIARAPVGKNEEECVIKGILFLKNRWEGTIGDCIEKLQGFPKNTATKLLTKLIESDLSINQYTDAYSGIEKLVEKDKVDTSLIYYSLFNSIAEKIQKKNGEVDIVVGDAFKNDSGKGFLENQLHAGSPRSRVTAWAILKLNSNEPLYSRSLVNDLRELGLSAIAKDMQQEMMSYGDMDSRWMADLIKSGEANPDAAAYFEFNPKNFSEAIELVANSNNKMDYVRLMQLISTSDLKIPMSAGPVTSRKLILDLEYPDESTRKQAYNVAGKLLSPSVTEALCKHVVGKDSALSKEALKEVRTLAELEIRRRINLKNLGEDVEKKEISEVIVKEVLKRLEVCQK